MAALLVLVLLYAANRGLLRYEMRRARDEQAERVQISRKLSY